jgi:hypothetical protein
MSVSSALKKYTVISCPLPQIPAVTVYQLTRFEFLTDLGGEEASSWAPVHNIFPVLAG